MDTQAALAVGQNALLMLATVPAAAAPDAFTAAAPATAQPAPATLYQKVARSLSGGEQPATVEPRT